MRGVFAILLFSASMSASCVTQTTPTGGDDSAMLQKAVDALDAACPNGGTMDLGYGNYNLSKIWTIASSQRQHHINIQGIGPNATVINCGVPDGQVCIYLNVEKYVTLKNFSLRRQDGNRWGTGVAFGGDLGTGTQSNGNIVEQVGVSNFHYGVAMSGGIGTSSETIFNKLVLQSNTYGFYCDNFNALNFEFHSLEMYSNTTGFYEGHSCNFTINSGDAETNGTAFDLHGDVDSASVINGFRVGLNGNNTALACSGNRDTITLNAFIATGATTPNSNTAIYLTQGCRTKILSSKIGGQISWTPGNNGSLSIDNTCVVDPNNTWTASNQTMGMGPGFRVGLNQTAVPWMVSNVEQAKDNCDTSIGYWPPARGSLMYTPVGAFTVTTTIN